jgi:hypothetical protein
VTKAEKKVHTISGTKISYYSGAMIHNDSKITVKALYLRHNMGSCVTVAGTGVKMYI